MNFGEYNMDMIWIWYGYEWIWDIKMHVMYVKQLMHVIWIWIDIAVDGFCGWIWIFLETWWIILSRICGSHQVSLAIASLTLLKFIPNIYSWFTHYHHHLIWIFHEINHMWKFPIWVNHPPARLSVTSREWCEFIKIQPIGMVFFFVDISGQYPHMYIYNHIYIII